MGETIAHQHHVLPTPVRLVDRSAIGNRQVLRSFAPPQCIFVAYGEYSFCNGAPNHRRARHNPFVKKAGGIMAFLHGGLSEGDTRSFVSEDKNIGRRRA